MEALGRVLNVQNAMDGLYVNLTNCGGVTFACYLTGAAGDTYTLVEAKTAGGGSAQNLATITRWHTNTGNGTDAWVKHTQAAAATVVAAATAAEQCVVIEVDVEELSDLYKFVKLTSTGAGLVVAITRDLKVQRAPANLAAMAV